MIFLRLAGAAALAAVPIQGAVLNVGDRVPETPFREVIQNWDGSDSFADYLGEPVLVDFWGTY